MADAQNFFSPNWYRVAGLRPRLLDHVRVERHRYGGQAWYALHDPLSGRVHRVTPAAYLFVVRMDGRRTVDGIWQGLVAELDTEAPGQEQVLQLLMQLHGVDLLQADITPDAAELLTRRDRLARSTWARNLRSPLSMQLPLLDPDRFLTRTLPLVRPLFSAAGLLLWIGLVAAGLATAGQHWRELTENVSDHVLAGEGLLALLLCYPVVKALHELGHGVRRQVFGCEVRSMGVMLLVGFPVPYVDASASAALRSKWQRAGIAAAGIVVELALAGGAALVWAASEPGVLRAVAFNVMLIGGVSTLVANGNPLLRFDGYYVLADLIEVPNLAQRSGRYLGHLVNRYLFALPQLGPFPAGGWERLAMLLYGPLSWAYRMTMLLTVALFVAANYFVLGVAAAAASVAVGLAWPVLRALWRVATSPAYRQRRARAAGITFGGIAAACAALLFVPAPLHTNTEGVVWLPEDAIVRAGADGFVRAVMAEPGAAVDQGALLFTLEHPVADARLRVQAAKVEELETRLLAEWVNDRVTAEVTRFELQQERAVLAREEERARRRAMTAPADGTFGTLRPTSDLVGRFVREGEVIGYVTPASGRVARIVVPQADIGLVQDHLRAVLVRLADKRTELRSGIARALPGAREELPSQALSRANGGQVSTDPRDNRGVRALERHFQFDVALPDGAATAGFGSRVHVRLEHDWEPVGLILYRRVRQVLLSRFEA